MIFFDEMTMKCEQRSRKKNRKDKGKADMEKKLMRWGEHRNIYHGWQQVAPKLWLPTFPKCSYQSTNRQS
ncbi:hypothetical protein GDO81_009460 [Engystomops pustulosus]|uniref:Uncharacterized protein n=1 Tax=Engystomops pustulosus TaxID=76066 RepID=A0AAV7BR46_ENGPU|nr:hypothetical protein GDO81_009460 [Engystomops pustulosus]